MRVNAIVNELNGEKIDIVPYSEDPVKFITAALSPATVLYIQLNPDDKSCLAVVPDDKLSLAIGKSGQNVRLAVKLTGWKIDVKAKSAVPSINITEENNDTESYDNLFDGEDAFAD
jgi:N utilization substance protein A